MRLSNGVDPGEDLPRPAQPIAFWSESYAFWAWDDANDLTVYAHFQRHPDDVGLWRAFCCVMLGETVFAQHGYGRGRTDGPGFAACRIEIEQPHRRWRLRVDGAGAERSEADLFMGGIGDGPATPMSLDLVLDCTSPVWTVAKQTPGTGEIMSAHYEQKGRVTGTVTLGSRRFAVDCPGANDHSHGPRNVTGLRDGAGFLTCAFPSGRNLTAIIMSPEAQFGYVDLGGGTQLPVRRASLPSCSFEPGSAGRVELDCTDQRFVLDVRVSSRLVPITLLPPNYERIGLVDSDRTAMAYTDMTCAISWDGEAGVGSWQACRVSR